MLLLGGISPKCVLTPQKKPGYYIFKMTIFSKFFGDFMRHIIRLNADQKINIFFELFINENLKNFYLIHFQSESRTDFCQLQILGIILYF